MKIYSFLFLTFLLFSKMTFSETVEFTPYKMKKGETISEILINHNLTPLYTEKEWVKSVLDLNRLSLEDAKKLRVGEIIVLPVSSRYFSADEVEENFVSKDKINEIVRSRMPLLPIKKNEIKRHLFEVKAGAFYQTQNISTLEKVNSFQNFSINLDYKYQNPRNRNKFRFNTGGSASVISRSGIDFEENSSLSASYTPGYSLSYFIEAEDRFEQIGYQLDTELESLSQIDILESGYVVRKDSILRIGGKVWKKFNFDNATADIQVSYHYSVFSNEQKLLSTVDTLKDYRYRLDTGLRFKNNYRAGVLAEYRASREGENVSTKTLGFSLGFLF